MDPAQISLWKPVLDTSFRTPITLPPRGTVSFNAVLAESAASQSKARNPVQQGAASNFSSPQGLIEPPPRAASNSKAIDAYQQQENQPIETKKTSGFQKYRDDQLLSNPGGDHYYLNQKKVLSDPKDQDSFWGRLKKDLSDAAGNVKNFFNNVLFGAKFHYRDENDQIQEAKKKGFVGSLVDFVKDVGSAFSFGAWRPDGEEAPQGFVKRIGFFFSKMKEAVFGDLIQGVSGSVVNMGEDLIFAGWNVAETLPDATLGNFKAGRDATSAVFDNGQVVMDYLTDILPSGEASVRVHALDLKNLKKIKPPIYNNLKRPERTKGDERWQYVRNTPFRKTIETIGTLFMDILSLDLAGRIELFSEEKK